MKHLISQLFFMTFLSCLIFTSCKKDGGMQSGDAGTPIITAIGTVTGQSETAKIGPEGGIVKSTDGLLFLNIPEGALPISTDISIQPITNEAPLGLGPGYRLGPEGVTFNKTVTLTFNYTEELLDSKPAELLWVVFQEDDGSWKGKLKSTIDPDKKMISVETSHFSDWMLGQFIDLTLQPPSRSVKKNESISLSITGFDKISIGDADDLTPLIAATSPEKILTAFKVVGWTLNGVKAPVSGKNGTLQGDKFNATYTAPTKVPRPNVVAVTAELEAFDGRGKKASFYLTSNLTITDEGYLIFTFDGATYTYNQFFGGFDVDGPGQYSIASCSMDEENRLVIGASNFVNGMPIDVLEIIVNHPNVGKRGMVGPDDDGNDFFGHTKIDDKNKKRSKLLTLTNIKRVLVQDGCDEVESSTDNISISIDEFQGDFFSFDDYGKSDTYVSGTFSGSIFYDDPSYSDACKSADVHVVNGGFRLKILKNLLEDDDDDRFDFF